MTSLKNFREPSSQGRVQSVSGKTVKNKLQPTILYPSYVLQKLPLCIQSLQTICFEPYSSIFYIFAI